MYGDIVDWNELVATADEQVFQSLAYHVVSEFISLYR